LRLGAVQALAGAPLAARASVVTPLAADPARAVRLAAAPLLAGADLAAMAPDERRDVDALSAEHRAWLAANADRAEAVVAVAGLHRAAGDGTMARAAFERALRLDDTSIVAYLNFADYLRGAGDDAAAEALLGQACTIYPESADVHHALGLALVRRKQHEQGVRHLARAAELAPGNSHYAYAYGVGLYSTHQLDRALATLKDARARFPENAQIDATLRALCADRPAGAGCP
jgi:tetratricopeptide (TPR) repeat protein